MRIGIIGGGPVGLTLGLLLNKINSKLTTKINISIFEKTINANLHPKAHVISSRGMEILRMAEIADQIYEKSED